MDSVLKKNKGLKTFWKIHSNYKNGEYEAKKEQVNIILIPEQIASYNYTSITSYEVERNFGQYKSDTQSDRRKLVFENLK